jgi:hypothetical protein
VRVVRVAWALRALMRPVCCLTQFTPSMWCTVPHPKERP